MISAAYGVPQELKDKAWGYLDELLREVLRRWQSGQKLTRLDKEYGIGCTAGPVFFVQFRTGNPIRCT